MDSSQAYLSSDQNAAQVGSSRFSFGGHDHHPESGFIDMDERLYHPRIGRFATPDPVVPLSFDGQAHNLHSYALNNPIRYRDPDGREPVAILTASSAGGPAGAGVGAAIVLGYAYYQNRDATNREIEYNAKRAWKEVKDAYHWSVNKLEDGWNAITGGGGGGGPPPAPDPVMIVRSVGSTTTGVAMASSGSTPAGYTTASFVGTSGPTEASAVTTPSAPTKAPTGAELKNNPAVQGALKNAYNASNPGDVKNAHEEGGWIYMNRTTGNIYALPKQPPGPKGTLSKGYLEIDLNHPKLIPGSVVVGTYHTHPAVPGRTAPPGPSVPDDLNEAQKQGVPGLVIDPSGIHDYGPTRRRNLDNGLGFPGWKE